AVILFREWQMLTKRRSRWWLLIGITYIGAATVCLVQLYLSTMSPMLILQLLLLVWCADITGYFVGKRYGKHKIAPKISPGKSWEGLIASAIVTGSIYAIIYSDYGDETALYIHPVIGAAIGTGFGFIGFLGDLFESSLKRHAGVKDSGKLIPGHGG